MFVWKINKIGIYILTYALYFYIHTHIYIYIYIYIYKTNQF